MFIANGRTVYRYSPANPAFFRWQSSWNAQAQRATLESSSHRPAQTKEKAAPCLSLQKAAAGRVFWDFTHTERPSSRPHRSPNPGKPFRFLLVFVHATACAKRPPPPALILVPQAILLPPGFCACGGVRARYLPPARTGPPIPASHSASSWSLCMRRCAPMRAVSRTCGAKFSGVAQKGAPSS